MGKNTRTHRKIKFKLPPVPKTEEEYLEERGNAFLCDMMFSIGKGDKSKAFDEAKADPIHCKIWMDFLDRYLSQIEVEGNCIAYELENPGPGSRPNLAISLNRLKLLRSLAMMLKDKLRSVYQPTITVLDDRYPNACVPECK